MIGHQQAQLPFLQEGTEIHEVKNADEAALLASLQAEQAALKQAGYQFIGYHGTYMDKAQRLIEEGIQFDLIELGGQRYSVFEGFYVTPSLECALRYAIPDYDAKDSRPAIVAVYLPKALMAKIHLVPNMNPDQDENLLPYLESVGLAAHMQQEELNEIPYGIGGPECANGKQELMLGAKLVLEAKVLPTYYENLFEVDAKLGQAYYLGFVPRRKITEHEEILPGSFQYAHDAEGQLVLVEIPQSGALEQSAFVLAFFNNAVCLPLEEALQSSI